LAPSIELIRQAADFFALISQLHLPNLLFQGTNELPCLGKALLRLNEDLIDLATGKDLIHFLYRFIQ